MLGGPDEPCIPRPHLARFAETYKRPCPRVVLEPENVAPAPLALLATQPDSFGWALPMLLADTPLGEPRRYAVWRIIAAIHDDEVSGRIEARRQAAIEAARKR